MSAGPVSMRLRLGLALALGIGTPLSGEPAGCPMLVAVVEGATGLTLAVPPAPDAEGWCVIGGARTLGEAAVRVGAEALRMRGEAEADGLVALEAEGSGLRIAPALNSRDMPDGLQDLLRMQTADFRLDLRRDEAADALVVEDGRLVLSGGTELLLSATIAGARFSAGSVLTARVTSLHLDVRNVGRVLHPILQALGRAVAPDASGSAAMEAARNTLLGVVGALAQGAVPEEAAMALGAYVRSLPEGRGRLVVDIVSADGIGAAQVGMLARYGAPFDPQALSRFLAGSQATVSWTPGPSP